MNKMMEKIFSDKKVAVITGAGISTLSGIPDFRGKNGLYTKGNNVEYMLSHECFVEEPDEFYNYYKENFMLGEMEPNIVHKTLALLEERGLISCVITQNIDNLHQKAGSKNVIDIHGNGDKFYCCSCKQSYKSSDYVQSNVCNICGGVIRPDVVLYNENLDRNKVEKAMEAIYDADVLVVLGTSLVVSTAGSLVEEFLLHKKEGFDADNLFIVNNQATPFDCYANKYEDDLGMVFKKVNDKIKK